MKFKLVQVFRGIAAMLVIMHHLIANSTNHLNYITYGNFFNFGFVGVDFFFILSGFIITYVHFPDLMESSKNRLAIFFKKRFIRIYPIYWIIAIVTVIIYYKNQPVFMQEADLKIDFTSWKSVKFLLESFLLIYDEKIRLVGVAWTLSYELLFYVIFGLGIFLKFKGAKIIACLWLLLILLFTFIIPNNNAFIKFFFNPIIIEFLVGCVVAYLVRKKINFPFKITLSLAAIIFFVLYNSFHMVGLVFHRDIYNVTLMSLLFGIITYMAVRFDQRNPTFKFPFILILIGDASYSIYLSHNMFLSALTRIYAKINPNYMNTGYLAIVCTIIFIIVVFLGILIHLLIEKKLLNFINKKFIAKKPKLYLQSFEG